MARDVLAGPNAKLLFRSKSTLRDCGVHRNREPHLLDCARAQNRAGLGTLRGPIFGRKGHAPEGGARCGKLQTDLCLAATHRTEERYMALLFLFRFVVPQVNRGTAGEAS